ncbi:sensor histidine kinase [Nocardia terpenica]|uniref:histidine kinase n=1 Tax=Nocardia terpenica TaxID=455432 RepID=A0A6G9YZ39_9NOCA|nr:HAMP domain-containing sensor histidine kinase [Nocardia terpenica]QIS18585.1 HAMP domain-containing protein [Nocardia terpenica]
MNVRAAVVRRVSAVPLRVGLVVAMVTLAGAVLLASGIAVTSALSRSLTARIDEQLRDSGSGWAKPRPMKQVDTPSGPRWIPADMPGPPPRPNSSSEQPRRFFELRKSPTGQIYVEHPGNGGSGPDITALPTQGIATVPASDGSSAKWRVLTVTNQYGSSTIGLALNDNRETVSRLILFQAGTGAVALLALGVVGYFVVRRSLRPLRQVEETAAAIAGGDLSRRVPVRNVDTEVDHLAQSLNAMLAQIQRGVIVTEASEEAARRSEAQMRRFVADASHELRTPLTTIRGFAELYRQGASKDPALVLERIEVEAERMGLLVEDLLMLARMDAQRPLARDPVDLLALAGDAVHSAQAVDARHDAPNHPVALEVRDGDGTLEVLGDAARLRQVLANLLGNALAHTPPGTPVTVRLTPAVDEVRIDVIDRGPGLSADAAARVFERFYRADASRTRASGGSGLGLSIVQALVRAHGGQVRVDSTPGEGTTFIVVLPRKPRA